MMDKVPSISVLMSVYKEPIDWLRQSIDSILTQSYQDFEFIIICDNPTYNEGISVLSEYAHKDSRVKIIKNDSNIGLTRSLNKGLSVAKGMYIARMDADDVSCPDRFKHQVEVLNGRSRCLCHTGKIIINEKNIETKVDVANNEIDYSLLFLRNIIAHPTVMFTADLLNLRGKLYNEDYKRGQDYELWTYLFLNDVDFEYIPQPLLLYRESDIQISRKHVGEQWHNSQQIRSKFVLDYLNRTGILLPELGLINTRKKIIAQISQAGSLVSESLGRILYLVDFTIASSHFFYMFLYYKDKSLFGKLPSQYTKMIWQSALNIKDYPYLMLQY